MQLIGCLSVLIAPPALGAKLSMVKAYQQGALVDRPIRYSGSCDTFPGVYPDLENDGELIQC